MTTQIVQAEVSNRATTVASDRARARARRRLRMRALTIALGLLLAAAAVMAAWPKPTTVEEASIRQGLLEVTVEEAGKTRVRDRYVVCAPLAGDLMRIQLRAGDSVVQGAPLAQIVPMSPALLDPRARAEAEGRLSVAIAAQRQGSTNLTHAELAADHAARDLETTKKLVASGALTADGERNADLEARLRSEELASATFGAQMAAHDVEVARAALARYGEGARARDVFPIASPVSGRVLRVAQQSGAVVSPGTPLLEVGDPAALEVVVDVLTSDAVRISPGAPVRLERWGSDAPLRAHVGLIEPSAFTKVSALGVEEQRVSTIIDFDEPRERWARLGDGYRVEARIVTWSQADVVVAPSSAVFRRGDAWAVFVDDDGRARLRTIDLGQRGATEVQVLSGVAPGDRVVVHPASALADGARIAAREGP